MNKALLRQGEKRSYEAIASEGCHDLVLRTADDVGVVFTNPIRPECAQSALDARAEAATLPSPICAIIVYRLGQVILDLCLRSFVSDSFCRHRLTVRTAGSHPANRGSIPRGGKEIECDLQRGSPRFIGRFFRHPV